MDASVAQGPRRGRSIRRVVVVGGLAVAMFVVGGIGLFGRGAGAPAPGAIRPLRGGGTGPSSKLADPPVLVSGTLAETIASLQARLRALPADWNSWAELGLAYVQEARVSADPSYYPKAEAVLRRSLQVRPEGNAAALAGLGALALARHDFAGALEMGRHAEAIDPYNATIRGVETDALIELGRYPEGFDELQHMVDLRPGLASYARVSYARELQGDVPGAERLMELALADATAPEDRAWTANQLGDLAFSRGRWDEAASWYRRAQEADPSFVPPMAGAARVQAARGHLDAAIGAYQRVVQRYPLPQYVVDLVDLQTVAGRAADAVSTTGVLHVEERLFRAAGVDMDLEVALFDADHGVDLPAGLAAARAEWDRRQSITVADALAWALHANGMDAEALPYANRALSLGTRNALLFFHRGEIERALGRTGAAKRDLATALDINPGFSILWGDRAAEDLRALGGRP